jgi:hypothetical protein
MGQPKAIESPEKLWELFQEFREYVVKNPFKEHDFVGKDATEVHRKKMRPVSWIGFEGWLASQKILVHLGHYEQNTDGGYADYLPIIHAIKAICSADIVEGGMAGIYNHNLSARLVGLADKKEVDKTVKTINFTDAG